jgi:hypothetical protein
MILCPTAAPHAIKGRDRNKHGIEAAQRAGAEIDQDADNLGNWLVGGEPWLREPAHPMAEQDSYVSPLAS